MAVGKIKVTEAAAILHVSDQFVRIGMPGHPGYLNYITADAIEQVKSMKKAPFFTVLFYQSSSSSSSSRSSAIVRL